MLMERDVPACHLRCLGPKSVSPACRSRCGMAQASRFLQPEGYKDRVRDLFLKRAVTYDDDPTFHGKVAQRVVEAGNLKPGHVVLDVACGTGLVSLSGVELVGPSGRVVGIDISPQMVEKAKAKSEKLNYTNIEFLVADVEEHSFLDASFDAIMAASAIPYLQHPASTFKSICRWLKAGGRFVFSTPQSPMFEATDTLNRLLSKRFGLHLMDAAGEVGVPEKVERVLQDAGFSDVQIIKQPDQYVMKGRTPQEFAERMWVQTSTFPMSPLSLALSPDHIESIRADYLAEVTQQGADMRVGDDIVNEYTEMIVVATT